MEIRKALTFRASSIGDCLMGKYLLENIHAQFPDARLGIVVASRGAMIRDLFAAYPWLEIIEANRYNPRALRGLWRDWRGSDLVITQYAGKHGGSFSFLSKLFARILAKRGGLVGFVDVSRWNKLLYSKQLPVRSDKAVAEHEREALRAAGLQVPLSFPMLASVRDDAVLARFSLKAGEYVLVHFFAGNKRRSLSPEKCRELVTALHTKLPRTPLVITGGAADRESAESIAQDLPAKVIAGDATLQEMMNLIERSRGVVSVDTGVAHIAAQLGRPLIVLRTCLGAGWWLPEQYSEHAPINVLSVDVVCANGHIRKDYPACINAITMQEVTSRATEIFP